MSTLGLIIMFVGKTLLWMVIGTAVIMLWYWWYYSRIGRHREARKEIFAYVKAYKRRCTGNNRFVVTVPVLQDAFREYETETINKVWLELIRERIIEPDPQDGEWVIR
jgi:hypothetical protein